MRAPSFDVIVPTVGRSSLATLLDALDASTGPRPGRVLVVDDRPDVSLPLPPAPGRVEVLLGEARGPAAARNTGWRASGAEWAAFLDDDVLPEDDWLQRLAEDLAAAAPDVGGVQGRLTVPRPPGRAMTDWERNVSGLERGRWITADMAYRRAALDQVGGFDERFPRAFREDADLGLRVGEAGWRIVPGRRRVVHPVRPADRWVSVRLQAGNADDALMRRLHGRRWRASAGVPAGRRPAHMATTAALGLAFAALLVGRRRLAAAGGLVWLGATAELGWRRIGPGPRSRTEVLTMLGTTPALAPVATWHWALGALRHRRADPWRSVLGRAMAA